MASPIPVTGGTGTLGRQAVPQLRHAGDDVRVLSRPAHQGAEGGTKVAEGNELMTGDLATGGGIEAAVAGTEDVSQVVLLAREPGLELAVRSGGHSLAGHSPTDGGIVLDLADMNALEIDPEQRTARAQRGLTGSPVPHIPPLTYGGGVVAAVALLGWLATVVPTRVALRTAPAEAIGMRE